MGIKVTESKCKKQLPKFKYPCLVQFSTGTVVLLTDVNTGTVIKESGTSMVAVGYYSDHWGTDYEPYEGSVTLTNE